MTEDIQLEKDLDEELLAMARTDLLAFTLATKADYFVNWHHRKLAAKLTAWAKGGIKYLMVFAPPRSGKSELVSRRLPAFLHGIDPDAEIMTASYLDSLAIEMCVGVQRIIDSAEYKMIFPDTQILPTRSEYIKGARNKTEHSIVNRKGSYRGSGIGGSFSGFGATHLIIDDPIKGRETADSEAFRSRLWKFWLNDLYSRLETNIKNGKAGQVLLTLTRWHEDDLAGRLLDHMRSDPKSIQWEIVRYPAIRSDMEDPEDERKLGEPLWPQKYSMEKLKEIQNTVGRRAWSSLYQQDPVPSDGFIFNEDMFQFVELPRQFHWSFITADTSYKEKEENDYTVFACFGVIDKEIFLRDVFRKKLRASDVETEVLPFIRKFLGYGYRATLIEPKGHGIYLNQKWMYLGLMIPSDADLRAFYSDRHLDKVQRANNAVPHLAARKIHINKEIPFKEELVAECLGFPRGRHDDFCDCLIDAIKKVHSSTVSILDVL